MYKQLILRAPFWEYKSTDSQLEVTKSNTWTYNLGISLLRNVKFIFRNQILDVEEVCLKIEI